jgi:c(7)-type cytochrome triheme protein
MNTCCNRSGARRSERSAAGVLLALCAWLWLSAAAAGQLYLPPYPPRDPGEYGRVVLNAQKATSPGGVVFDHWLHRAKFTCRLCHVDLGFAMEAGETGVTAKGNEQGYQCGACHDGRRTIDGKVIFAACSQQPVTEACYRCHSVGRNGVRKIDYKHFTAKLPKGIYGVNWEDAEDRGQIKLIDTLDGISGRSSSLAVRKDFAVESKETWVHPITFSHKLHTAWSGCELCHPDIFPTAKRDTVSFSMFSNLEHRNCGACHGRVASPLNNCQKCHKAGPTWAP